MDEQVYYELITVGNKVNGLEQVMLTQAQLINQLIQMINIQSGTINNLTDGVVRLQAQVQDIADTDYTVEGLDEVKGLQGIIIEELHALQDVVILLDEAHSQQKMGVYNSTSNV